MCYEDVPPRIEKNVQLENVLTGGQEERHGERYDHPSHSIYRKIRDSGPTSIKKFSCHIPLLTRIRIINSKWLHLQRLSNNNKHSTEDDTITKFAHA